MDVRSPRLYALFLLAPAVLLCASSTRAQPPEFPERQALTLAPPVLTPGSITSLLGTLDALLEQPGDASGWAARAVTPLGEFVRRIEAANLPESQEARVLAHLDGIAARHPAGAALIRQSQTAVRQLRVGKTAPEIVGVDLDQRPLRLSDYRGKVVLLNFSAEWCGICRTQEPYQRLLLELYRNWPFAIASVETGASPESVKRGKADARLDYRSWWDGNPDGQLGAIAASWSVTGFPRSFLIDADGVIRFVDLRDEDLLKGVKQLLNETE